MNNRQITIPLITRTGLHVGSGSGNAVTDDLVLRNASGSPVIPGTSIAGALRAIATRIAPRLPLPEARMCKALEREPEASPCGCIVCQLFGDIYPGDDGDRQATAGRLWVQDAHINSRIIGSVIDGVGIDRETGAAYRQGNIKYDLEVLPPGIEFTLTLELRAPEEQTDVDAEEQLLAAVLAEWQAGRGTLGGRVSRGLGAIEVLKRPSIVYRAFDFQSSDDLMAFLVEDDPWTKASANPGWLQQRLSELQDKGTVGVRTEQLGLVARSWITVTAIVKAAGGFLISDPVTAARSGFDRAPLLVAADPTRPYLPGSSLKGVLRSQAEKIARTVSTFDTEKRYADSSDREVHFKRYCPACNPLVGKDDANRPLTSCDTLLEVPALKEIKPDQVCLACQLFGSPRNGSRLRIEDARLIGTPFYKPRDFLAIDRFTGGGAEHLKFDASLLWQPTFEITLFLENPCPWELGWLWLALHDIHDGLATIGSGGAKGFGRLYATSCTAKIGSIDATDRQALSLPPASKTERSGMYQVTTVTLDDNHMLSAIDKWVADFVKKATTFDRAARPLSGMRSDSYFGTKAEALYPIEEVAHDG